MISVSTLVGNEYILIKVRVTINRVIKIIVLFFLS